jgi:hypothetical protein
LKIKKSKKSKMPLPTRTNWWFYILVMTFEEYIDIKWKGRATQLCMPEVAVGKKRERL